MANARSSKRQLEKARQEKAALKRDRRQGKAPDEAGGDEEQTDAPAGPRPSQEQVLARLAKLHQLFGDEQISFEEFEEQKAELTLQLQVD